MESKKILEALSPEVVEDEQTGQKRLVFDGDALKGLLSKEASIILEDSGRGLKVVLSSQTKGIDELASLGTACYKFLEERRENPKETKSPLGVD